MLKDLLLKAQIKAANVFGRVNDLREGEHGDVVQVILLIAGFVFIVIVTLGFLSGAIKFQAQQTSSCIETVNKSGTCSNF